jgi:hypothetical protein
MATIKGKWVFNETVPVNVGLTQNVNFTSNGNSFTKMSIDSDNYILQYNNTYAYEMGDWFPDAYRYVDFGETEQTVIDTFLTWITANATQQADPTPINAVTIEYNNTVIATLAKGVATLPCEDKVMHTDVVITVPKMSGEVISEWDGSYTVSGGTISFTITYNNGTIETYEAENGMTWGEWVESSYNTGGFVDYNGEINVGGGFVYAGGRVKASDIIQADYAYEFHIGSGN